MKIAALAIAAALGCAPIGLPAASQAAAESAPQVEPAAVNALAKMSAFLRTVPAFQINMRTYRDDVDAYGQLITLAGGATYNVRRPNAFDILLHLPSLGARYVYDGKTVTVYDTNAKLYSTYQAPGTIRDTLELARDRYGAEVPLQDLFTWTEGDSRAQALTSAHYIGKSKIDGATASQYAFRQPGVDWQIWIADGDQPTPLRVVIVSSKDPAHPQFRAELAWNLAPKFAPGVFAFVPPADARAVQARASR